MDERRAPVQCDPGHGMPLLYPNAKPPGTIAWSEHVEAWEAYARRFGNSQSAERIAERGGFGFGELVTLLECEPATWRPRQ